ncbi:hypothetical protein ACIO93_36030 [Streptomyces sp. NPDC087903]|uniref:hypothetical protein n=1 Tax=Streptomyces sp. NPDC087903 TaxID=3365819 RepID=UPI0037FCD5CD
MLVYTTLCVLITIACDADVDAQAGAYATGILTMMVSGAFAVTVSVVRGRRRVNATGFAARTAVLLYALVAHIVDKPNDIVISGMFIVSVLLLSRVSHITEPRADCIVFDPAARRCDPARPALRHRYSAALLLRVGRRQRAPPHVPLLPARPRRHGSGHPRDQPQQGT